MDSINILFLTLLNRIKQYERIEVETHVGTRRIKFFQVGFVESHARGAYEISSNKRSKGYNILQKLCVGRSLTCRDKLEKLILKINPPIIVQLKK